MDTRVNRCEDAHVLRHTGGNSNGISERFSVRHSRSCRRSGLRSTTVRTMVSFRTDGPVTRSLLHCHQLLPQQGTGYLTLNEVLNGQIVPITGSLTFAPGPNVVPYKDDEDDDGNPLCYQYDRSGNV